MADNDQPTEEQLSERRSFKRAADELYMASLPRRFIDELLDEGLLDEEPDATEAARVLALLSDDTAPDKLHAVASAVNRRPRLASEEAPASELGRAIVTPVLRDNGQVVSEVADDLRRFADEARRERAELTPERWQRFIAHVIEAAPDRFGIEIDIDEPMGAQVGKKGPSSGGRARARRATAKKATEAGASAITAAPPGAPEGRARRATRSWLPYKPGCNDGIVTSTAAGLAPTIKSRFWTNADFPAASKFVDPDNWVTCGWPFWERMAPIREVAFASDPATSISRREAVYEEVVNLPALGRVQVHLLVRITKAPTSVVVEYTLDDSSPRRDVVYDTGWLLATAETVPYGSRDGGTYVEGVKSIRFRDNFWNQFPDLACDGGWVYLMIGMALGGGVAPPAASLSAASGAGAASAAPTPSDPLDAIGTVVDDWVADVSRSLASHGRSLKSAYGRALLRPYDPRWVNDLLDMGVGATSTLKSTLTAWRQGLAELAKLAGQR